MKDLYSESYKKQMKDIKEDTNTQKTSCVYGLEELLLLKCQYY